MSDPIEPSPSNPFAKAAAGAGAPGPSKRRLLFALGLALTLVLAALGTLALFFLGALVVRGVRNGDWIALGAAAAVLALTAVMARGRAKKQT